MPVAVWGVTIVAVVTVLVQVHAAALHPGILSAFSAFNAKVHHTMMVTSVDAIVGSFAHPLNVPTPNP